MCTTVVRDKHDHRRPQSVTIVDVDNGDADEREGLLLPLPDAPAAIELRHLRAFMAVAEELNFGRAAARLYISPPALSRQIRMLERLVGCELLRRSTHRVELTLAGEALLDRAGQLLIDLNESIQAVRLVGGELQTRMTQLWEPTSSPTSMDTELQDLRNGYETLLGQFAAPAEIQVRSANTGGVPSLLLATDPDRPADLLYLHGGGNIAGSAFGYRALAGALAAAADTAVALPEYRLAPEHPFPAAVDDALRAYQWMLGQGIAARQVTVCGDSSGAGLVLSLLLSLKEQGEPMPGGAVLLCPGLLPPQDRPLSEAAPLWTEAQQARYAGYYLAGHPHDDPIVAPLNADLTGLPPLCIQAGTGDELLVDARRIADHARRHGVEASLELYPVATHVFQLFWSFLPEAVDAVHNAGTFTARIRASAGSTANR